jgi:hypothetical protein
MPPDADNAYSPKEDDDTHGNGEETNNKDVTDKTDEETDMTDEDTTGKNTTSEDTRHFKHEIPKASISLSPSLTKNLRPNHNESVTTGNEGNRGPSRAVPTHMPLSLMKGMQGNQHKVSILLRAVFNY